MKSPVILGVLVGAFPILQRKISPVLEENRDFSQEEHQHRGPGVTVTAVVEK
jgi:hypothetical protein